MEDTIFSKILAHEIPAEIVYEDENVLAFLDIRPNNFGHTLVIPKEYSRNILTISPESWGKVMEVVRVLATAIKEALDADGVNIKMNNEEAGGQDVFHTHVHIIPRYKDDGLTYWPSKQYAEDQAAEVGEKIRAAL
jgi:histidine triad (HIT) family protein